MPTGLRKLKTCMTLLRIRGYFFPGVQLLVCKKVKQIFQDGRFFTTSRDFHFGNMFILPMDSILNRFPFPIF
jgi:hypothetical protein